MPISLTPIVAVLVRVVLLVSGLVSFGLSFFHGPDLNLLFFVGISMFVVAGSPYAVTSTRLKLWGIAASTIAFILYSYLVTVMLQGSLLNKAVVVSDIVFFIPLLCLLYLLIYFSSKRNPDGAR